MRDPARTHPSPHAWRSAGAVWVLLLCAAPPLAPWLWGANALRSLPPSSAAGVVLASCVVGACAWFASRRVTERSAHLVWACAALAMSVFVAWTMRETAHVLGDTWVRVRTITNYPGFPTHPAQFAALASILHAAPLDLLANVVAPLALRHGLGVPAPDAISAVCALEALLFFAGVWRITRRLDSRGDPSTRVLVAALLCTSGSIEVFAGYAESAGLVLALLPWWGDAMLGALARPCDAWRLAAAWGALVLAHRLALVLALPIAWRLALPYAGDAPRARVHAAIASAMMLCAALAIGASSSGLQLTHDRADLAIMWFTPGARPSLTFVGGDLLNALLLVAPVATLLSGFLVDATSVRAALRDPRVRMLCVTALPFLLLAPIVPWGRNGLGGQRDWDTNVLLGFVLTLTTITIASASLPAMTLRRAAVVLLPLLTLHAGGWITLQANERACLARANALAVGPPLLPVPQQVHVASYLGERCRVTGYPEASARFYEQAARINPNAHDALRAADAWLAAGHRDDARRMLAIARRSAPSLDPIAQRAAVALDSALLVIPAIVQH